MSLSTVKGSQKMEDTITSYSEESMWQEVKIKKQKKKLCSFEVRKKSFT